MDDHERKQKESFVSRRALFKGAGVGVAGMAAAYALDKVGLLPDALTRGFSANKGFGEPPTDKMTYRTHPGSGDKISLLGFGCMRFPMLPQATSPGGTQIDERAAFALVDYALAHGVNYFDTAYTYHRGISEVVMGKALKRHPRETYFVATKMPGRLLPTLEQAKEMFETQLERTQLEYIDYYLLHNLQSVDVYQQVYEKNGVLEYLLEQKEKGRIRNLGWSFHGDEAMLEYILSRDVKWDFAQVQLNYHDLMHQYITPPALAAMLDALQVVPAQTQWMYEKVLAAELPLIVMEPLLGGRLARLNKKSLAILQEERPQDSAASWAIRYVAGLPNVLTVLSGMTYMEHLQDNIRTCAPFTPLTEKESGVLKSALDVFLSADNIRCTRCGYCMPCPYGIDIPEVFTHYNNCLDDELLPKDARHADYVQQRRAYLVSQERDVPELRRAERCTGCNKCVKQCPQYINIPQEMARLGKFVEELRVKG